MSTVHATLIDYKFRMLMASVNHRKKVEKQNNQRNDFQMVQTPRVEEVIAEEQQNY